MSNYANPSKPEGIAKAKEGLAKRGFEVHTVKNAAEARKTVLGLVKKGAEVFTMASKTLEVIGITADINEGDAYDSVRGNLAKFDPKTEGRAMRKYGAAPDVAIGSVHGLTEDGILLIASLTGSQLPAYAAGAESVIFVVGSQKIVKNLDDAMDRLTTHVIPLESDRARKAYGLPEGFQSAANKILLIQGEMTPGRIKVVIVEEALGF